MATTIETLGSLIEDGFKVSIHCHNQFCRHSADLDLHALAERLGMEFVAIGQPNPLAARMRCAKCQGKDLGLILLPRTGYTDSPASAVILLPDIRPEDRPRVKGRRSRRRVRL